MLTAVCTVSALVALLLPGCNRHGRERSRGSSRQSACRECDRIIEAPVYRVDGNGVLHAGAGVHHLGSCEVRLKSACTTLVPVPERDAAWGEPTASSTTFKVAANCPAKAGEVGRMSNAGDIRAAGAMQEQLHPGVGTLKRGRIIATTP